MNEELNFDGLIFGNFGNRGDKIFEIAGKDLKMPCKVMGFLAYLQPAKINFS